MSGQEKEAAFLTGQEVADYIGANYEDAKNKALIDELIEEAEIEISGAVGDSFPRGDPRARLLGKLLCADAYNNRFSLNDLKTEGNARRRIDNLYTQLRAELRNRYL